MTVFFTTLIIVKIMISCVDKEVTAECVQGYHGSDCSLPCRYPSYGEYCQLQCHCKMEHCNHISGCSNSVSYNENWHEGALPNRPFFQRTVMFTSICTLGSVFLVLTIIYCAINRRSCHCETS
uniref:Uncharacterized protein LOC111103008 n=1 Tax=Crassostrea virginica TaxID=6565 RepID=A0A8B8AKI7_CRAVI|nr:uncharacterized protein LOC111103008 [Crassostrea virginica]